MTALMLCVGIVIGACVITHQMQPRRRDEFDSFLEWEQLQAHVNAGRADFGGHDDV
jgi:hypothetical protein